MVYCRSGKTFSSSYLYNNLIICFKYLYSNLLCLTILSWLVIFLKETAHVINFSTIDVYPTIEIQLKIMQTAAIMEVIQIFFNGNLKFQMGTFSLKILDFSRTIWHSPLTSIHDCDSSVQQIVYCVGRCTFRCGGI